MATAFTPGLRVERSVTVRRIRELPLKGETLCAIGDLVSAEKKVARASLPGDLTIARIPEQLGIHPSEVIRGLKVKVGDVVKEGELICEHAGLFGLFKSRFFSPLSGTIEFITERTGHLGIRGAPKLLELDAYISGKVVAISQGSSVTIETLGSFVQGIFGIGGERRGVIHLLSISSNDEVLPEHIPQSCSGAILVGGMRPSIETLKLAASRGAVGFVTGSIDDQALSAYLGYDLGIALTGDEDVPMTLIITEGFGAMPLSLRIHELLKTHEGKSASINGATQVRAGALRPEIIIPEFSESGKKATERNLSLEIGSSVRIIRVPYFGKYAVVTELPHELSELATGSHARVLKAKLENGELVVVPRANVELVS